MRHPNARRALWKSKSGLRVTEAELNEQVIRGEIFSAERLERYALYLAAELKVTPAPRERRTLLPRLEQNSARLADAYRLLTMAVRERRAIPPAGEWLIDNYHVIEDQIREIREDLPEEYYRELPKLASGALAGYPRVYAIALTLVAHLDSFLDVQAIERFVRAFQTVAPLSIGELWAIAISLRIALVENLRRLSVHVVHIYETKRTADDIAERMLAGIGRPIHEIRALIGEVERLVGVTRLTDCAVVAQMSRRLRDQDPELLPAWDYLENICVSNEQTIEQYVHADHQEQAATQITIGNIISSMRLLSRVDWKRFFERVSLTEAELARDPAGVYSAMDFASRDRCRHVVERIARTLRQDEVAVARAACDRAAAAAATAPSDRRRGHVGYYLIGPGLAEFERALQYTPPLFDRLRRSMLAHPTKHYMGWFALFLGALLALAAAYAAEAGGSIAQICLVLAAATIPFSDVAVLLLNFFTTRLLPPRLLARIDLERGIPDSGRTFVVVPTIFSNAESVRNLLERLEIHFLANNDPNLAFALLADFSDAASETLPEDESLRAFAETWIAELNRRHGHGEQRFYFFLRKRLWNPVEGKWMGWERKRGKLHEFNRFLRGDANTTFTVKPERSEWIARTRYVITLDSDTRLPHDSAKKLIGMILHPLNEPQLDPVTRRVTEGYGILQPRISIAPESSGASWFAHVFSGHTGIDPYTTAVSDVYQDLFGEGIYTGKGLYVVDAFEAALAERVPENRLLSHDLFEGNYARAALVTNVEFLDDYPMRYAAYSERQHRWTRGDWQIAAWVLPRVPTPGGTSARNVLPLIARWKIFDNLRRSFVAPGALLWFLLGWTVLPGHSLVWTVAGVAIVVFPACVHATSALLLRPGALPWTSYFWNIWGNLRTNVAQSFLSLAFLVHQALLQGDAVLRTLWRLYVSRRRLLEWTPAAAIEANGKSGATRAERIFVVARILPLTIIALLFWRAPSALWSAAPLLILWALAPEVARAASRPIRRKAPELTQDEKIEVRRIARHTWHFFETFVNEKSHWLPPDNFQEDPEPVIAHRTSPTNMGLLLLSTVSAHDFGYLSTTELLDRLERTLDTMDRLERVHGHFFNWYDTVSLRPLPPRYVSTVDSGNLAGHLIAVKQACLGLVNDDLVPRRMIAGIVDTLRIAKARIARTDAILLQGGTVASGQLAAEVERCLSAAAARTPADLSEWTAWFATLAEKLSDIADMLRALAYGNSEDRDLAVLLGWIDSASRQASAALAQLSAHGEGETFRSRIAARARALAERCHDLALAMDFSVLIDEQRKIFVIGYNTTEGRKDDGYYDLLASEARLGSFWAIAKGDVPQIHWFHLGRQRTLLRGRHVLISWSASIFEYLMPLLVMRDYEGTLLHETHRAVVALQMSYRRGQGLPWGVSEAGYTSRDLEMNYQYGPFGIPGLGLKRGLGEEYVVSPYSTALAALVDPKGAIANFRRLVAEGMFTDYGFYESIDYTPERQPPGRTKTVTRNFMAHHQGMVLTALNNVLHGNVLQDRFHSDPMVRSAELLLQERIPARGAIFYPRAEEVKAESPPESSATIVVRTFRSPATPHPETHVLSNGEYSVMLTAAGAGFSRLGELAITRWREDPTRDDSGSFIFLRDLATGGLWSAGFQPTAREPHKYEATFAEHKVDFWRQDGDWITHTEIVVSPEDNVELRRVTLTNLGSETKAIEATSYMEPVLTTAEADLAHTAFSKMFLDTEYVPSKSALLARRRPRAASEAELWGFHLVAVEGEARGRTEFETDRTRFLGRGRSIGAPAVIATERRLSGTVGSVLDPIFSLRRSLSVAPQAVARFTFVTGAVRSRDEALRLIDRYHDIHSFTRECDLAWTQSQVEMRHFSVSAEEANLYQRLASVILYSAPALRAPLRVLSQNQLPQSRLWGFGIGGDLPIVLVTVAGGRDLLLARDLLRAHDYLRRKRVPFDLVLWSDEKGSYHMSLLEEIHRQVRIAGAQGWVDKPGGVHVVRGDLLSEAEAALLESAARAVFRSDRGSFREQIRRLGGRAKPLLAARPVRESDTHELPALPVRFFNGLGGFTEAGREYVITLKGEQTTPAPWINIVANSRDFGFLVSESGSGYTWAGNSRENRLTPWSNDPETDPSGEIVYLRDLENGAIWSPTAWPIRSGGPFRVAHGQGYSRFTSVVHGIEAELTLFVPLDAEVKIGRLRLKNVSGRRRKLALSYYVEWVLGTQRQKTAHHIVCELGGRPGLLLARNPYSDEFGDRIAFSALNGSISGFTCDRREFLGRNGNYASPQGLSGKGLKGAHGAALDPCAVIEARIDFAAGTETELLLLLGQAGSKTEAETLAARFLEREAVERAFHAVREFWERTLTAVQVKTPAPEFDLLVNRWILYQTLVCRVWARAAFYQSGGAYGFRDQLQDVMALAETAPEIARSHILRAASRQFPEGDVQHWWHPPRGRGVRTHFSDDLLWLPYVACDYVNRIGDHAIWDEKIPFLVGQELPPDREDIYFQPQVANESATLFEHCARAIDRSLKTGAHGLPLMGSGDWNDGMNRVGHGGKGESVWMGWFLGKVARDFALVCRERGQTERAVRYEAHARALAAALERDAWDGEWYLRAFFDDGTPLGSRQNDECKIDSIAQSWAVISGLGDPARARQALAAVARELVRSEDRLILLFKPPFDKTRLDPGYIKGYKPGIRENGGQYTHAGAWAAMAFALLGEGDTAFELLNFLNPITHTATRAGVQKYKAEPFVTSADVYAVAPHAGRAGWTWYTGSAGWIYRVGMEQILGIQRRGRTLRFAPCLPRAWPEYAVDYAYGKTRYRIHVRNPHALMRGRVAVVLDGVAQERAEIALVDDEHDHAVTVQLERELPAGPTARDEAPVVL